jgi:hypothetical protein
LSGLIPSQMILAIASISTDRIARTISIHDDGSPRPRW